MSLFAFLDRLDHAMQRSLRWWMSAPCDERAAIVMLIAPLLAVLIFVLACPPPPLPGR